MAYPKKDKQSKLNVQSNEEGNFLPAHFVDNVLPKLLKEVHKCQDLGLSGPSRDPVDKKETAKGSVEVTTKQSGFRCKECDFVGKSSTILSTHNKNEHKKEIEPVQQFQSKLLVIAISYQWMTSLSNST